MNFCFIEGLIKFGSNGNWITFNNVRGCLSVNEQGIEFNGDFTVGKASVINGTVNLNNWILNSTQELLKSIAVSGVSSNTCAMDQDEVDSERPLVCTEANPFLDAIERATMKNFHRYTIQECKDIKQSMTIPSLDQIQSLVNPKLDRTFHHILFNKNIIATGKTYRRPYNSGTKSALSTQSSVEGDEKAKKFYRYTIQQCNEIKEKISGQSLDYVHPLLNPKLKDYVYYVLFDKDIVVNEEGKYVYAKHESAQSTESVGGMKEEQNYLQPVEVK